MTLDVESGIKTPFHSIAYLCVHFLVSFGMFLVPSNFTEKDKLWKVISKPSDDQT